MGGNVEEGANGETPGTEAQTIPADLAAALALQPAADRAFRTLPPSHRREYLLWIEQAMKPETRQRREAETVRRVTDHAERAE